MQEASGSFDNISFEVMEKNLKGLISILCLNEQGPMLFVIDILAVCAVYKAMVKWWKEGRSDPVAMRGVLFAMTVRIAYFLLTRFEFYQLMM